MALSGFPDEIEVTLGSGWTGHHGLSADDVLVLTRVGTTDEWTEDGTDTPDDTNNRLKFRPSNVWSNYYEAEISGVTPDNNSWSYIQYWTIQTDTYTFKEIWNGSPNMNSVNYDYSMYTDHMSSRTYNPDTFSSMSEYSGGSESYSANSLQHDNLIGSATVSEDTISGTVTLNGSGVEGAKVRIVNQTIGQLVTTETTNTDGAYSYETHRVNDVFHVSFEYTDGSGTKYNAKSLWNIDPQS